MIEVVSYPHNLGAWNLSGDPYFEFYGETKPLLYMDHLETVATSSDDAMKTGLFMPVYEYFWTLGVSEDNPNQVVIYSGMTIPEPRSGYFFRELVGGASAK
jgi:hypothetical protein